MKQQSTTRRGVLTLAGGTLVALAGCANDGPTQTPTETATETVGPIDTETETDGDAMLRVAHLSPDAPNVDVAVDENTVLEDVAFETVSAYLEVTTGEHQITVTPTDGTDPVFDQSVSLESGRQTAAAIGSVSGEEASFTVSLFSDRNTLPESGTTNVRAVHTIPDGPTVDVTAGETVIADAIEFGDAGSYISAPADVAAVELRPDSESNDADPVGTFDISLTDGATQTVFATGYLSPSGDQPGPRVVVATEVTPGAGTATETETGTDTETETGTDTETETGTDTETETGTATETETLTEPA